MSIVNLNTVVREFGMQYEGESLHTIYLDTALVKGKVIIWVRKQFPVEEVFSILGNDPLRKGRF